MARTSEAQEVVGTDIVSLSDDQVEAALKGELAAEGITIEIQDPRAVQTQIIERILASADADAVFGGQQALGGRDVLDRPFVLSGIRWHKSKFEGDIPVFAVLDATFLDDGESAAVTTSASNVMAQAYALNKLGALPCNVKIVEAEKDTAAGYRPQWLVRA